MTRPWIAVRLVAVTSSLIVLERIVSGLSVLPGRPKRSQKTKQLPAPR